MKFEEYVSHDALSLADLVRRKEVTAGELLDAAVSRLEAVNPRINAVIHRLETTARAHISAGLPDGPFRGVPFLLKDLDGMMAGAPFNAGSRSLRDYVAPEDSELVRRHRAAGLVIFGKTNTPEFGMVAFTEPALHGPTRNPWNLEHTPGGSSGGSAAAVAAGIVPMAHGADGGGSLRIPASSCGLFGMKPSRGRVPMGPESAEGWHGFAVRHGLSRSVRDSAALLDATHGPDVGAPYVATAPTGPYLAEVGRDPGKLRIAFTTRSLFGQHMHPDCSQAAEAAAKLVASLGHEVTEAAPPFDAETLRNAYLTVVVAGVADAVRDTEAMTGRPARAANFEPVTWFAAQAGHAFSAADLEHARTVIGRATRKVAGFFETYDVLITATTAYPPVRIGELAAQTHELAGMALLRRAPVAGVIRSVLRSMAAGMFEKTPNTMLFNMTGQPAMSVPLSWTAQGLPIGVQFVGRHGDETTLFRLAGQLETAQPWFKRRPAI